MSIRLAPSTESISFKRYQTSFYYETMNFIKEDLIDFTDKGFFSHMLDQDDTLTEADFKDKNADGMKNLHKLRTDLLKDPTKIISDNLEKHIFTDQILKQLFKYSIFNLFKTQKNTLFILPCFDQENDNGASRFNKYITYNDIDKELYNDIFTNTQYTKFNIIKKEVIVAYETALDNTKKLLEEAVKKKNAAQADQAAKAEEEEEQAKKNHEENINKVYKNTNQIIFIKPFSTDTNENIDSYKDRIKENINNIKETIKNKGNDIQNQAFTQIICFVNNDNTIFTNYFKTELKKNILKN